MGNPLSAGSLALFMSLSLPTDQEPQIQSPYDAIALAVHAGMIAVGFRLVGLGEDHRIEAHSDAQQVESLPKEWNASSTHAFRYKHDQSSMEYLLKSNRLGSKAVVNAIVLEGDKTASFDLNVKDYISESSLPATPRPGETPAEEATRPILNIFISEGRLSDLGSLIRLNIISKLAPGLRKEGYEEQQERPETVQERQAQDRRPPGYDPLRDPEPGPARPHPFNDPLAQPPRPRVPPGDFAPPGFEDEYEMNRPPRGYPGPGGRAPLNIGHDDLYPAGLGPHDPLQPNFTPGGGGLPRPGGFGGMHPTFDDPLFAGQGQRGPFSGQVPPGARYDPIGPGEDPRDNRGRQGGGFPGGRGGFGGAPPNPFGGYGSGDFI